MIPDDNAAPRMLQAARRDDEWHVPRVAEPDDDFEPEYDARDYDPAAENRYERFYDRMWGD